MKTKQFIRLLEATIKSADPTVISVSWGNREQKAIEVKLSDNSTISIDVEDCTLLDVMETSAFAITAEHKKDSLHLTPQRVTRKGIFVNGKWICSEELLMNYGQYMFVIPCGRGVILQNSVTGKILGGFLLD